MSTFDLPNSTPVLAKLPAEAREWLTQLPWEQRQYLLPLFHLLCTASSSEQTKFLDAYTAGGLLSRAVSKRDARQRVNELLAGFHITTGLNDEMVRSYVHQAYLHSIQDAQDQPEMYLEAALMLVRNVAEHDSILSYILGFEILKMLFSMSWEQHERLYKLQPNQDDFTREYIRPVQAAHKRHRIVVPTGVKNFFSRRDYFVRQPNLSEAKTTELIFESFSAEKIIGIGFLVLRHPNAIHFDYDYVYNSDGQAGSNRVKP